ncbi:protein kinase domain-containing protein [Pendulispora albinea]|uniref:Serine/threonine-protein kinase n=1 Tax=Pendulispora albinea TaxID=2741071 RepID=A0ABZ2LW25_9BACT
MSSCESNRVEAGPSGKPTEEQQREVGGSDTVTEPSPPARHDLAGPLTMGERVGRYVVVDWLGEGGMGVVYAAHDPELDRTIALKILRAGASDTEVDHGERLLREARAMARVGHPNVVTVFDAGFHGDRIFIAMERVSGTTLREWLQAKKRPWREVVQVFVEAGRGIAAAHAAGLVHRDFKPENVLIGRDGRVRVSDFGLARADAGAPTVRDSHAPSEDGANARRVAHDPSLAFGTPAYMSPEQLRFEHAGAASDQFSFAVALYEGLYGERPFAGMTLPERGRNIMEGRISEVPKGSDVPSWLRKAVVRALAGHPSVRHPSMNALLEAIGRNPRRAWRRRGVWIAWAALTVLVFFGARNLWRPSEPKCSGLDRKLSGVWDDARKRAVHDAFRATGLPYAEHTFKTVSGALDTYARDWVRGRVDACEATWVRGEQSSERLDARMECLDERLNELNALAGVYTRADAATMQNAVGAAQSLVQPARCADARALPSNAGAPSNPAMAARVFALRTALAEAKALRDAGHFKEAMASMQPAVSEALAIGEASLETRALRLHGDLLIQTGSPPKEAEAELYRAAWAADRAHDDAARAEAWIDLLYVVGHLQLRANDLHLINGEAISAIARAGSNQELEIARRRRLASAYREQGRFAEARAELEPALAMARAHFGPESRELAACLLDAGWLLHVLGENAAAREHVEGGRAIYERLLGSDHPNIAVALNRLGAILSAERKYAEAEMHFRRALAIAESVHGGVHSVVAVYLDNLADALTARQKYGEAIVLHTRALGISERLYGPEHSELVSSLLGLGITYFESGDTASARLHLERALRLCTDGIDPQFRADVQFHLAKALEPRQVARARSLALAARDTYRDGQAESAAALPRLEAWLAAHPAGR